MSKKYMCKYLGSIRMISGSSRFVFICNKFCRGKKKYKKILASNKSTLLVVE